MNLLVDSDEWHFGIFGIMVRITMLTRDIGTMATPFPAASTSCIFGRNDPRSNHKEGIAPVQRPAHGINTKLLRPDHYFPGALDVSLRSSKPRVKALVQHALVLCIMLGWVDVWIVRPSGWTPCFHPGLPSTYR